MIEPEREEALPFTSAYLLPATVPGIPGVLKILRFRLVDDHGSKIERGRTTWNFASRFFCVEICAPNSP